MHLNIPAKCEEVNLNFMHGDSILKFHLSVLQLASREERRLIEVTSDIVIVIFTQNCVKVEIKLVSHTESVAADLTSKAVEMINVLTSPHHHFQRRYGFHTLRTNSSGSKQSAINSIQEREHIIVQQNTGAT